MSKDFPLKAGDPAPSFTLLGDDGLSHKLSDFQGKRLVLYFYPKDDTPGCTQEACDFRDQISGFEEKKSRIIGISPDSVESHKKFKAKYGIPFLLLSDPGSEVARKFGAFGTKNLYGKISEGIIRTTCVIDETLHILKIYPKVSVNGHVERVASFLEESSK